MTLAPAPNPQERLPRAVSPFPSGTELPCFGRSTVIIISLRPAFAYS